MDIFYATCRNNDDGPSKEGMTVFLAAPRERSSRDGMTHGSLVDKESQKIAKAVLSQPWQNCILS